MSEALLEIQPNYNRAPGACVAGTRRMDQEQRYGIDLECE
jgi:hypothetical protein